MRRMRFAWVLPGTGIGPALYDLYVIPTGMEHTRTCANKISISYDFVPSQTHISISCISIALRAFVDWQIKDANEDVRGHRCAWWISQNQL